MRHSWKEKRGLAVRLLLSVALLTGLAYQIGAGEILARTADVRWPVIMLTIMILAANVLVVTPRWSTILAALGYRIRASALLGSVFLGFLFNQLLPTAVGGDALRAWRARQLGVPLTLGIHSVLLDRLAGIFVVLFGTVLLVPFAQPLSLRAGMLPLVGMIAGGLCLICVALWALPRLPCSPTSLLGRLQAAIGGFAASLRALLCRPGSLLVVLMLSTLGQLIVVGAVALLAMELNIRMSLLDFAVIGFGAMLAASIPISVAGWGVREGAVVLLFSFYGVPPEAAFAVSVLFGACLVAASSPGVLVLFAGWRGSAPAQPP